MRLFQMCVIKTVGQVPDHLRDSHYSGASKLGQGLTYKYAHNYPNGYVKQQYLPDPLIHASIIRASIVG